MIRIACAPGPDRRISRRATIALKIVSASAGRRLISRRKSSCSMTSTRPAAVARQLRKRRWPVNSVSSPTKPPGPNFATTSVSVPSNRTTSSSPSRITYRSYDASPASNSSCPDVIACSAPNGAICASSAGLRSGQATGSSLSGALITLAPRSPGDGGVGDRVDACEFALQLVAEAVAGRERSRLGVADLGLFPAGPDEHLEREIERRQRLCDHHRCPRLRAAEDHKFRIAQVEAAACGLAAVIDHIEQLHVTSFHDRREARDGVGHRGGAELGHDLLTSRRAGAGLHGDGLSLLITHRYSFRVGFGSRPSASGRRPEQHQGLAPVCVLDVDRAHSGLALEHVYLTRLVDKVLDLLAPAWAEPDHEHVVAIVVADRRQSHPFGLDLRADLRPIDLHRNGRRRVEPPERIEIGPPFRLWDLARCVRHRSLLVASRGPTATVPNRTAACRVFGKA